MSWTEATDGLRTNGYGDRIELVYHRAGSEPATAVSMRKSTSVPTRFCTAARTAPRATRWSRRPRCFQRSGGYDNAIWVDPSDVDNNSATDVLVCGGVDLYRSVDGGVTFTKISEWFNWPTSAHADHHASVEALGINGVTNCTVYFGNDGGVWRTDDIYSVAPLTGWVNLNSGYAVTQFYGGARHANSDIVVGGTQDNGSLRTSGGATTWTTMFGGDGGFAASDPTNGGTSSSYIYDGIGDAGLSTNATSLRRSFSIPTTRRRCWPLARACGAATTRRPRRPAGPRSSPPSLP